MRTNSPAKRALLQSKEYDFHARAEVQKDDGTWQDMSNLGGYDWLDSAKWSDGNDPPAMEGSITFGREHYDGGPSILSLAPYLQSSPLNSNSSFLYAPQIKGGRGITLQTAYTAKGVAPVFADWDEVFNGYIHNPEWGGDDPIVTCNIRDLGGYLMSQWTESERDYGVAIGAPFETVLQAILDANPSRKFGIIPLYTPVSPGTNLRIVKIPRKPILMALRDLAAEIGWDVKYRYDASGQFRLTFFEPDRNKTVPDFTLSPAEYISIESMEWPTDDIRNKVEVTGFDGVTGAALSAIAEDTSSQDEYGVKYMRLGQDFSSNINTQTEVDDLASVILQDLSRPFATQRLRMPFFWIGQTGDLVSIDPNFVHHDEALKLSIRQVDYEISRADGDTSISFSEQVAGFYKEWLRKEDINPPPPQGPTLSARFTTDVNWLGYVYLTPSSPQGKKLGIRYLDNGYWGMPTGVEMYLCVSNVDNTPRLVDSDVEIDPATAYFTDGVTAIVGPLATISLVPGKTLIWMFQAVDSQSGLKSDWLSVGLDFSKPMIQAADISFYESDPTNPASAQLNFQVQSRQLTGSIRVDLHTADVWTGGPYLTTRYYTLLPGQSVTDLYTSLTLSRQAAYFLRAIPFAGPLVAGLPTGIQGDPVYASTFAPFRAAPQVQVNAVIADVTAVNTSQVLVSTPPTGAFPNARQVASSSSVALDTSVAGSAQFYVPALGIDAAKLGTGAVTRTKILDGEVTVPKLDPGGTTPGSDKYYRGDGKWMPPVVGGGTGTGAVAAYTETTIVTASLANGAATTMIVTMARTIALQRIVASAACWIRLYPTLAALNADLARGDVDPTYDGTTEPIFDAAPGLGAAGLTIERKRDIVCHNWDTPRIGRFYARITNKSGGTAALTITFRYLPFEADPAVVPPDVTGGGLIYRFNAQTEPVVADGTEKLSLVNTGSLGGTWGNSSMFGSGPTYRTNQINGHPAIKFTSIGGNTRPYGASVSPGATPTEAHVFIVFKTAGGGAVLGAGPGNTETSVPNAAGNITDHFETTSTRTVPITNNPTTPFLYHAHSSAAIWEAFVGLTQVFTNAVNTLSWAGILIGGFFAGGFFTNMFEGYIGEVRVYTGPLSSDDVIGIKTQMAIDWGVSL